MTTVFYNFKFMNRILSFITLTIAILAFVSCGTKMGKEEKMEFSRKGIVPELLKIVPVQGIDITQKVNAYAKVTLSSDLSHLSARERELLPYLFEAAQIIDELFWMQKFGPKDAFFAKVENQELRQFLEINYGPWDQLNNNSPFIEGVGEKPAGANFYPADMTKDEFEQLADTNKTSQYTLIRRDEEGKLKVVWYHQAYESKLKKAAELLKKAASLSENEAFKNYLNLRAEALVTDNYQPSDFAWMDMKDSNIDLVIGPIENYEDGLYGYKTAFESFILIKDNQWSEMLKKFSAMLPDLQKQLPCEDKYKTEVPGSGSDMNVYDVIYYAGDCNSGSKTIAINLPNDEQVQLEKGSRKLQLKNAMKAKFDKILVPIADLLITPDQRKHITFDAFFENTMFHEVAHGIGIKNTINGKGTVREALKEQYSAIEENKADILGLFLVTQLYEMGELSSGEVMNNYVTFMAGIFRSVRFGAASAHGKANMMRFAYFQEKNAFLRNADGTYTVDFEAMKAAMNSLSSSILQLQGEGDYESAKTWVETRGVIPAVLQEDLNRVNAANIPIDIVFEQGVKVAGL